MPEREAPAMEGNVKKYLRGNEFLMINPYKKPKKLKKAGVKGRRKSISKKNKSPSPKKKRRDSGSDDMEL